MYDPQNPAHTTLYAQAIYAKLQKLSEDIQLQHSIINAQKETVLKSRQRIYVANPKPDPTADPTHAVHAHADTVVQHRAMIIKHYELIQQHKQMVKEQGLHVQNLTSTLLNIQQETTVVDELMNTKMAENRRSSPPTPSPSKILIPPSSTLSDFSTSPIIPSSPDISLKDRSISKDAGSNKRRATFRPTTTDTQLVLSTLNEEETETKIEKDESKKDITDDKNNTIHMSFVSEDNDEPNDPHITSIIVTTTSTSTTSTPTSKSMSTTTVSSVSTSTVTTTTATTTTTTTFSPSNSPICTPEPLPLSP